MDRWPVKGIPEDSWDRLQSPCDPELKKVQLVEVELSWVELKLRKIYLKKNCFGIVSEIKLNNDGMTFKLISDIAITT